ncbi:solute carrier family 35 member SLC35F1/F2/F6, partial [Syncephalis pseudoplumigaleata]
MESGLSAEAAPKSSLWAYLRTPRFIKALLLGQLLALCITGSNTSTTKLAQEYNINAPTMQSCLNYILLALAYNGWMLGKHGGRHWLAMLRDRGWKYIILGVVDVEANYFVVKAYQYTSLTSAMLLDSWAIPCCMILSYFMLRRRYRWLQYLGVLLCLAGAGLLFKSDMEADHDYAARDALRGDLYCILGATLYGISNVLEEKLATTYEITEVIGMLGLVGAITSGIQLSVLERNELATMTWSGPVIGYLVMFDLCMFCLYSCVPLLFRLSSATFFNMSLLTSDFYSLIVSLLMFNAKV